MMNSITVDVEEFFHPAEVSGLVPQNQWDTMPSRVEQATRRILETFSDADIKGTFFILGWVAHRYPRLIREIAEAGHEIGCHSYYHRLIYDLTPDEFRADTELAVKAIADACGIRPLAYRAPSYSITGKSLWALDVLAECGFTRDSSIYPISHDRYGIIGYSRHAQLVATSAGPLLEIPIATAKLPGGSVTPVGGGGYLRLLPYRYTAAGIRRLNREGHPACIYFHPWEIDKDQPRLECGFIGRLRTYTGIRGMGKKIARLLKDFSFSTAGEVFPIPSEYPLSSPNLAPPAKRPRSETSKPVRAAV